MTDKKSDKPQDDRARPTPVLTTPANKRPSAQTTPETASTQRKSTATRSALAPVAVVLSLLALGFAAYSWQQQQELRTEYSRLAADLASSKSQTDRTGTQVQSVADRVSAQEKQTQALRAELATASAIIQDLDEALRSMTERGSELVLLNDIDHLATIAQQQLELGGNVRNAIVALESVQAQLARANRPALASLLQTVNGDLERLRAASTIDIAAFSRQLDELAMLLTEAPLVVPDESARSTRASTAGEATIEREQPAPTVPPADQTDGPWWEEAWDTSRDWTRSVWDSLRDDLGRFIDVRRVDDASALLMSPDQAARFRENLRTRVMTAQLALMMRQPEVWQTETQAIVKAIETRYDETSPLTRKALRMARHMADTAIDEPLPTVNNTLQALNKLREEQRQQFGADDTDGALPGANGSRAPAESPTNEPASNESSSAQPSADQPSAPQSSADSGQPQRSSEQTEDPESNEAQGSVPNNAEPGPAAQTGG